MIIVYHPPTEVSLEGKQLCKKSLAYTCILKLGNDMQKKALTA